MDTQTKSNQVEILSLFEFQTKLLGILREFSQHSISEHDANIIHHVLDMAIERHNFIKRITAESQTEAELIENGLLYKDDPAVMAVIEREENKQVLDQLVKLVCNDSKVSTDAEFVS